MGVYNLPIVNPEPLEENEADVGYPLLRNMNALPASAILQAGQALRPLGTASRLWEHSKYPALQIKDITNIIIIISRRPLLFS